MPYGIALAYVVGLIIVAAVAALDSRSAWALIAYVGLFLQFAVVIIVVAFSKLIGRCLAWLRDHPPRATPSSFRPDPLWDRWLDG